MDSAYNGYCLCGCGRAAYAQSYSDYCSKEADTEQHECADKKCPILVNIDEEFCGECLLKANEDFRFIFK